MPKPKRSLQQLLPPAFALAMLFAPTPALAQGEHARRAASELLVMLGDARKLSATPLPSARHSKGLKDRLRGGLAGLDILLRLADQERMRKTEDTDAAASVTQALRKNLSQKDLAAFKAKLSTLIGRYPLTTTGILPTPSLSADVKSGQKIHEELCAGCHDSPDTDVERPAYNLFNEAKAMPQREFAARMILGVRGDRVTGISNPLTDSQIAALIGYYRKAKPQAQ